MSDLDQNTAALEERKFLHDIANPLATCMLIAEILGDTNPDPKMAKLMKSLTAMQKLIQDRRQVLIDTMKK